MANWLMELTKLSKTDKTALELLRQLKSASTEEEKEKAKQDGKTYIENIKAKTSTPETTKGEVQPTLDEAESGNNRDGEGNSATPPAETENTPDEEGVVNDEGMAGDSNMASDELPEEPAQTKVVDKKYDMSEPAFNPRLAKMGITREEELFQLGVYVRKLTREEKFEIRRSIYQKKKKHMADTQNRFREERAKRIAALEADPEYQKYKHQQKFVVRIEEALKAHCNIEWMFRNIEGLNVEVMRELLKNPANVNKFKTQKDDFVKNFEKKYGL